MLAETRQWTVVSSRSVNLDCLSCFRRRACMIDLLEIICGLTSPNSCRYFPTSSIDRPNEVMNFPEIERSQLDQTNELRICLCLFLFFDSRVDVAWPNEHIHLIPFAKSGRPPWNLALSWEPLTFFYDWRDELLRNFGKISNPLFWRHLFLVWDLWLLKDDNPFYETVKANPCFR